METCVKTITIDGQEYVRKDASMQPAVPVDGMNYVIVRTYSAGVFAGYLAKINGKEATIKMARRIFYWDGAASISQMAMEGVSKPKNCKFPCEVSSLDVTEVIEVLQCTEKARLSIKGVKIWQS